MHGISKYDQQLRPTIWSQLTWTEASLWLHQHLLCSKALQERPVDLAAAVGPLEGDTREIGASATVVAAF